MGPVPISSLIKGRGKEKRNVCEIVQAKALLKEFCIQFAILSGTFVLDCRMRCFPS